MNSIHLIILVTSLFLSGYQTKPTAVITNSTGHPINASVSMKNATNVTRTTESVTFSLVNIGKIKTNSSNTTEPKGNEIHVNESATDLENKVNSKNDTSEELPMADTQVSKENATLNTNLTSVTSNQPFSNNETAKPPIKTPSKTETRTLNSTEQTPLMVATPVTPSKVIWTNVNHTFELPDLGQMNESFWTHEWTSTTHPDEINVVQDPCTIVGEEVLKITGINFTKEEMQNKLANLTFITQSNEEQLTRVKKNLTECVESETLGLLAIIPECQVIKAFIDQVCAASGTSCTNLLVKAVKRLRKVIDADQLSDALLMLGACAEQNYE